ncbi:hypothetical protein BH09BAC5_BH09BAC5_04040 [soil metagenome]
MSEKRPTVVITGANGFIGKHLAEFFVAKNWNVIGVVRIAPEIHLKNVLYYQHDLSKSEGIVLPDEITVFIHAGYIKNENGVDAFQLNKQSSSQFLNALSGKKVKQKIFLSSLSADKNALSVYGKQKASIEDLFLEEDGTVIRAGLVLGNGGLFNAMRQYLKINNKIPLFGNGAQPLQTVFIDDLILAIDKIIEKDLKGNFVIATEEPVPYHEFYNALAATVGVKPKFMKIPYWLASFGIKFGKIIGKKIPVTKDNLLGLKQMKKINSENDLKKLGIKLRDYKESFDALK